MAMENGQGYGGQRGPAAGFTGPAGRGGGGAGQERRPRLPAALRAPVEARSWREFGYVLLSLPVSVLVFSYAVTLAFAGSLLLVTFLGIPVLAVGLAGCRGFGVLERKMARGLLGLDLPEPEPVRATRSGA